VTTLPTVYPHATAIISILEDDGFLVGDHVAPKSTTGNIVAPCVVLYMIQSPSPTGSLARSDEDAVFRFRLTSVALTAGEALDHADRVAASVTAFPLVVDDREVFRLRRVNPAGCQRDDDVTPQCFYVPDLYSLLTVSAVDES
jgi:hypothetical protein